MDRETKRRLLVALNDRRLAILGGAGLSMGPPTKLMSAADLTQTAVAKYEDITGESVPAHCRTDLEQFARYLYGQDDLIDPFTRSIVPWERNFQRRPNPGHAAVADFLISKAVKATVSTNYDTHIEDAAFDLGEEDLRGARSGHEANQVSRYSPLLKLHGCFRQGRTETIWVPEQCDEPPLQDRIESAKDWLRGTLQGMDFLFVGFWSDWAYLNGILEDAVAPLSPRTVIVVDPRSDGDLKAKAPGLWDWANECADWFKHEQCNGEVFLDELRRQLALQFLRKLFRVSEEVHRTEFGQPPTSDGSEFQTLNSEQLYGWRKDLAGAGPRQPVRTLDTSGKELMGALILWLNSQGWSVRGRTLIKGDRSIRVLNVPNRLISSVQAEFEDPGHELGGVDEVVCVGGRRDAAVSNVVRGPRPDNVVRPSVTSKWRNEGEFLSEVEPE